MDTDSLSYSDIIASLVVISVVVFVLLVLLGVREATLEDISISWYGIYSFVLLMSATKLYGKGVYDAVKTIGAGLLGIDGKDTDSDKDSTQ